MRPSAYYAPLVVSIVVSIVVSVIFWPLSRSVEIAAISLMLSTAFSYLGFFVFVYPLFVFLEKKNKLSVFAFFISGLVGGALVYLVFVLLMGSVFGSTSEISIKQVLFGAFLGVFVALVFCYFAGIRNIFPER